MHINSRSRIDEAAAIRAAELALGGQELFGEHAAEAARKGRPGQPLLVECLADACVDYYLIPWNTGRGTELILRVDAFTGTFLSVVQIAETTGSYLLSSRDALIRARAELPGVEFEAPRCVWLPCRQSTSPLRPFHEVPYEGGVLYVDMDGEVYRKLTPLGHGGQ